MRIVAGKFKGLKLNEFELDNVRPTIDRVREAIFNKIQFKVVGAAVLDLFGGTGAFSLEFYSRNAGKVITVDSNKDSIKLIKTNFKKAKIEPDLINDDYLVALKKLMHQEIKFDIVFLDPPFTSDYAEIALPLIASHLLKEDGLIIYEHSLDKKFKVPSSLMVEDEKKYGTVVVTYLEKNNG